jgi:hypothetical protein
LDQPEDRFPWGQAAIAAAGFILLVGAIPLAEHLIPERYPAGSAEIALSNLESRLAAATPDSSLDPAALRRFLNTGGQAVIGRAFYPRWYAAGDGLSLDTWSSYATRAYPRLGFYLVGSDSRPVVLPAQLPPGYFPNSADVLVLGCPREDHFEAYLVAFQEKAGEVVYQSPLNSWDCNP